VGEDQVQHLELTRMLARRFNSLYSHLFTEPEPYVIKEVARVMSLRDPKKKMSKSGNSNDAIFLNDSQDDIQKKIRSAVTDSGSVLKIDDIGPALKNLLSIYIAFSEKSAEEVLNKFDGKGYAAIKNDVADLLIEKLTPIHNKIRDYLDNESSLMANLQLGARRANEVAQKNLREMKTRMGFTQIS
jgi:tryptophanyl-tRNA synthetase